MNNLHQLLLATQHHHQRRKCLAMRGESDVLAPPSGDLGDGSRISHTGATAIGGLIRDDASTLVRAFCANVGNCSITRAELRAIVGGLKLAWSLGIRKVDVQTDSATVVAMLQVVDRPLHMHATLVAEFQALQTR
ncbi:Putative ribonuclease H protein At1g65750 [Linum perenne]